ncbi:hypothetical protein ABT279_48440, partial [Amycolatopsis sp. NPDC000673]|uniref:hypothetical protein n=1 Tax=Amycolatopsis sp. NPDC000673 TaxID=3154267 RepID=UPI00331A334D
AERREPGAAIAAADLPTAEQILPEIAVKAAYGPKNTVAVVFGDPGAEELRAAAEAGAARPVPVRPANGAEELFAGLTVNDLAKGGYVAARGPRAMWTAAAAPTKAGADAMAAGQAQPETKPRKPQAAVTEAGAEAMAERQVKRRKRPAAPSTAGPAAAGTGPSDDVAAVFPAPAEALAELDKGAAEVAGIVMARHDVSGDLKTELPAVALVFHTGQKPVGQVHDSWRVLVERKIDAALAAAGSPLRVSGVGLTVGLASVADKNLAGGWAELMVDQRPRERLSRLRAASSAELTIMKDSQARFTGSSLRRVGWGAAGVVAASWLGGGAGAVRGPVTVTVDRITPLVEATRTTVMKQVREELLWGAALALAVARERGWPAEALPSPEEALPEVAVVDNRIKKGLGSQNNDSLPARVQFAQPEGAGATAEAVEAFLAGTESRIAGLLGEDGEARPGRRSVRRGDARQGGGVLREALPDDDAQAAIDAAAQRFGDAFGDAFDEGAGEGPSSNARSGMAHQPGFVTDQWTDDWLDAAPRQTAGGPASDRLQTLQDRTRRPAAGGEEPAPGRAVSGQGKAKGQSGGPGGASSQSVSGQDMVPPGGLGWMGHVAVPEDFAWEGLSAATQRLVDEAPGYERGRDDNPAVGFRVFLRLRERVGDGGLTGDRGGQL